MSLRWRCPLCGERIWFAKRCNPCVERIKERMAERLMDAIRAAAAMYGNAAVPTDARLHPAQKAREVN